MRLESLLIREWTDARLVLTAGSALVPSADPGPLPCECSDIDARPEYDQPVDVGARCGPATHVRTGLIPFLYLQYTCLQVRAFGNCHLESIIKGSECCPSFWPHFAPYQRVAACPAAPSDAPEGYCMITCGRCDCCAPIKGTMAAQTNYTFGLFSKALDLAKLTDVVENPGVEYTVLVPTDSGVQASLQELGYSSIEAFAAGEPAKFKATVLQHFIVPVPGYMVDSTNFFLDGAVSHTANGNSTIRFSRPIGAWAFGDGSFKAQGPKNSAGLLAAEIGACKSYIIPVDTMLIADTQPAPAVTATQGP